MAAQPSDLQDLGKSPNSRSPGALVPNLSRLPGSGASLAPRRDAVAQAGGRLEVRGEALGGEVLRPRP